MTLEDEYKILIGAYYGICELDNYDLKEYLLKDISNQIDLFLKNNPIPDFEEIKNKYKEEASLKVKFQDSLIVLNKMNAKMDVILLVKERLRLLK